MAMQHLNSPVVGDERHGATTDPHQRVMLHAYALEFLHPASDDPVRFEAPTPVVSLVEVKLTKPGGSFARQSMLNAMV